MKAIEIGTLVQVTKAYDGGGVFYNDGCEGIYTVVGVLSRADYYLAKGDLRHDPKKSHWNLIIHQSRIEVI